MRKMMDLLCRILTTAIPRQLRSRVIDSDTIRRLINLPIDALKVFVNATFKSQTRSEKAIEFVPRKVPAFLRLALRF